METKIAIIGLGYVGLPLAIEFAKKYEVLGFDINSTRIEELSNAIDRTQEADLTSLKEALGKALNFSDNTEDLKVCNVFIVTVPTPIDQFNAPDLRPLIKASETVGKLLKKGDIVIYESTVYPGCTEEDCVPVLEQGSGLTFNVDFFAGYSPERINPGDKVNTLTNIKKVTSGSTPETAERIDMLYRSIITAGTHKASSIKVAEAAKVIENAQRDINIAFVNELAKIFNSLGIDTEEVLQAAGSKWNFLKFSPGLVGGHCIGVDPYYLAQKAQEVGYHPEIILAGRRMNDGMGAYVAQEFVGLMIQKEIPVKHANVLVLGVTFKENCPDVRNTKVIDILSSLKKYSINPTVYDPWADPKEVEREYGVRAHNKLSGQNSFDGVILAVAHDEFRTLDVSSLCKENKVIYDVKGLFPKSMVDARL